MLGKFIFGSNCPNIKGKGKSKAIPLQAWRDPEDSRKMRLPDLKKVGT